MVVKKNKEVAEVATKSIDLSKIILALALIISLIVLASLYVSYLNLKKEMSYLQDPQAQEARIKRETQDLINQVGKLMVLPEGEPTVATVVDAEALAKEQEFFKDAKNGDKVLIYKDKAILFNVSEGRIVNVGPVFSTNPTGTEAQSNTLNIEVRNGSKKIGAANELGDQLKAKGFNVAEVANATKADYEQSVLINLTGKDVKALEAELGLIATDKLPDGEATSTQDVVVILGNKK
jgi:hypothetical protein